MNDSKRILLIPTGGTIDSVPYELDKVPHIITPSEPADSIVASTVRKLPRGENVDEYTWLGNGRRFIKDSKEFSNTDLQELADIMKHDEHNYFVITHGTDQMAQNAATLAKHMEGSGKTVAFVGSIVPLSVRPKTSDAIPALKFTLKNIYHQKPGVYVVGHDRHTKRLNFFDPATVEKDFDASWDLAHQRKNQRLIFRDKSPQTSR